MEKFALKFRSIIFKLIILVFILSPKLLTKVNVNESQILAFTGAAKEPIQSFALNKAQVSVLNPNIEQIRDLYTDTALQLNFWTLYVYSNGIGSILSGRERCVIFTYFIRYVNNISVTNTTTQQEVKYPGILLVRGSLPNNSVKSIENESSQYNSPFIRSFKKPDIYTNKRIQLIVLRAMGTFIICLFIINQYFNCPKTLIANICNAYFGTNRMDVDTCSNMYFKSKYVKDTRAYISDMLFTLRVQSVPHSKIVVCPSSMESYLQDIKNKTSTHDSMKNEWARYNSFRNFPKTSYMTPIRLAQEGFYYSGIGESVTCFSCGQNYDTWNEYETASEVHRRISPNCSFVCGEDYSNISIHDSSDQGRINSSSINFNATNKSTNGNQEVNGADGGPEDTLSATEPHLSSRKEDHKQQTHQSGKLNAANTTVCGESPIVSSSNTSHAGDINQRSRFIRSNTTISFNNAKHPEYAVKSVRESSYAGWREHMSPVELSEGGFYYAGFQDCVRCFYCGGGLKNWDYGDSPWMEHARWYPNCDYLRQVKGEEFVQRYREDGGTEDQLEATNNMNNGLEISAACSANEGNINTHYTLDVDMNSADVARLLEMGYTKDTVENAVRQYRQTNGNRPITAELLLNIIIDSDQSQTNQSYLNTSALGITTTFNVTTRAETTSHNNTSASDIAKSEGQNDKAKSKPTTNKPRASKRAEYTSLVEENRSLREQMLCKICMDNDANIVFLPCGHLVACTECAPAIRKCTVCMKLIKGTVRAFPSY